MPRWLLVAVGHDLSVDIAGDQTLTVGRAPDCEVVIPDVTVSRRHAELTGSAGGLRIRDLGSSNGTTLNGLRIESGDAVPGDIVAFGKVTFRLAHPEADPEPVDPETSGGTLRPLAPRGEASLESRQLARILDLAKRLSGEFDLDRLTEAIVELTFDLLPVDRVSLLLLDEASGALIPARSKSRLAEGTAFRVPQSIARRAVADRVPILTESAVDDERFRSGSVMMQSVRSAISTPLLASRDRVLGVLYVDSLTAERPFQDDEASMLFAFGGLAAVSLGKLAYAEEARREAEVRANFERFFAPEVAARIARERGTIDLAGERRAVAVLFCDIRGFTAIAESLAPEETGALLTEYFNEMADVIFEFGGTLDKFIGDAVLAVWGAPLSAPDDADRALAAARAMGDRIGLLNARSRQRGRPELRIGIGINFGEVFAGYLGSTRRLEYSVIGDPVNVASRLSGDAGPGEILVSEAFITRLRTRPPLDRLADVTLRNRTRPVTVYRLKTG
ncbi:MAG: adenylate/guanylate cyclase domain-containing protein [Gemmatimonadales bacterium]